MTGKVRPGSLCCAGSPEEIIQVDIFGDGQTVGLSGLTSIFERLYAAHRAPDTFAELELVRLAAQQNYIPTALKAIYGAALVREYVKFCYKKDAPWLR